MKYLDYPQFAELSRALTFTSSECTVFTRIEAYSCKPAGNEKRLFKHIQRTYAPEIAARKYGIPAEDAYDDDKEDEGTGEDDHAKLPSTSPRPGSSLSTSSVTLPPHLVESPFGNLAESSAARKLLFTLIATLNAAFPDHDFADIPVSTFRREPSPAYVVHSLSSTLQSLRRNAAGNNPDAPAAAATSPPNPARSAADSATAFLSAAPRTFAGLPASFDSSPSHAISGATASSSRSFGSPSLTATFSPPGHLAQLSLGSSVTSTVVSPQPPVIALPPAVSQSNTFSTAGPSAPSRTASDPNVNHNSSSGSYSRSPISPRLGASSARTSHNSGGEHQSGALTVTSPPSHTVQPAAINAATHPALASILDDIMCVEECEVYSFHPDIEYDPHASADDDEERLLEAAIGADVSGGLGLFEDERMDDRGIDIRPSTHRSSQNGSGYASSRHAFGAGHPTDSSNTTTRARRRTNDNLEDIAERWADEDEIHIDEEDNFDDDVEDPVRAETTARSERAQDRIARAGRAAVAAAALASGAEADADAEMADDALLFDEDVYGQGLSGTQTPRAPTDGQRDRFSSHAQSGRRTAGPADPSTRNPWARESAAHMSEDRMDEDDVLDSEDDEDLSDFGAEDDEDDSAAAGLLWATYAFFYNRRLKRVLFVSVWARTNAGVEAHAAAAAAAARARERAMMRMSTSPHALFGNGAGQATSATSSSWPGQGATGAGGKASSWNGRILPAQRAISVAMGTPTSKESADGGFAAKASRAAAAAAATTKRGSARAKASPTSRKGASSTTASPGGRKESSVSRKTRREAMGAGGGAGDGVPVPARRRKSSLGQSVTSASDDQADMDEEGQAADRASRGATPIASSAAETRSGGDGKDQGAGRPSKTVSNAAVLDALRPAPAAVSAVAAALSPGSRHGTPPPPSARSPFPHASPRKPVEVAATREHVLGGRSSTTSSITGSAVPIPISSSSSRSDVFGSMPSLDGAVLSASAGGGGPGARSGGVGSLGSSASSSSRQLPKRLHSDRAGDSKRQRMEAD